MYCKWEDKNLFGFEKVNVEYAASKKAYCEGYGSNESEANTAAGNGLEDDDEDAEEKALDKANEDIRDQREPNAGPPSEVEVGGAEVKPD